MSVDTTKEVRVLHLEVDDEVDLEDDPYGDNDNAIFMFATVTEVGSVYKNEDGEAWININTTQGDFDFPAGHWIKRKVVE